MGANPKKSTLQVEILRSHASRGTSLRIGVTEGSLLIDCGDGTASALFGRPGVCRTLRGLALTHGHPDHVGGLYSLLSALRLAGRTESLDILVPEGCREAGLLHGAWRRRYPEELTFSTRIRELRPGRAVRVGPFRLRPFGVRHRGDLGGGRRGLLPALGYDLRFGGLRVVVSGDTGPCEALRRAVTGADLALIEATLATPRPDLPDFHLSVAEARALGSRARSYRLYHLSSESRALVRRREIGGRHRLRVTS
jgi:ribonuclease Z